MKKRAKKKAKPANSNRGPVPPKCSQLTADSIAALTDEELLDGCPYPCGSGAKVEWLRMRVERFAKSGPKEENTHMEGVMFNPLDNPYVIRRPISGHHCSSERHIVTKLALPE